MNFPLGKIFLGDGGAYFLGFALGWMAVLLSSRNPQVSPWACFLVCGYPIIETLFSILRRVKRQAHFGHPDRLHLHSLVRARWVQRHWGHWPAVLRNSMTSLPMWAYAGSLVFAASVWYDQPQLMLLSVFAAAAFYWVWYLRLVRFGREYRTRT
jgi:UDP-N-acetylmuramyl pentapeptide phosphotransferase/UDP-N-acetylglucosamine-1-phosphate transferase